MLHFSFALMAAGLNLGEAQQVAIAEAPQAEASVAQAVPDETAEAVDEAASAPAPSLETVQPAPTVSIGSGVVVG